MSLLDKASLIITPNAYKESVLYSVVPNTTLGDMNVVRATTATRVNSAGLIESVGLNIPRIDYTNASCPSILVEPQRNNLVFPSATLTTQTRTVTAVANTLSFYGTGTIVLSGVHIATLTGTGANNRVSLTFTPTAGSLILTVTGTVTNAQLELGSYDTSYIPTVASTVTRNADVISKTGISSLIGQTEGVLFVESATLFNDLTPRLLSLSNGATTNRIFISYSATSNTITLAVVSAGITILNINYLVSNTTQFAKIAVRYSNTLGYSLWVNGVNRGSNALGTIPASMSRLGFDNGAGGTFFFGKTKQVQLYKTALSDTEMEILTTL